MHYRFFHVPALFPQQAEKELNQFLSSHRILSVEKELVGNGEQSAWLFCIHYLPGQATTLAEKSKGGIDYQKVLPPQEFATFAKLRKLRKQIAEQSGLPPYAVFTNEQLADLVRNKVTTETAMSEVDGIGKARLEKYAEAFLELLKQEFDQ